MKTLIASLLLAMSALAMAQQADKPYTPKWRLLDIGIPFVNFFIDLTSVSVPNANGEFLFVMKVVYKLPLTSNNKPIDNRMLLNTANCNTGQSVVTADSAFLGNEMVSTGELSSNDKMSQSDPNSAHGIVMLAVCQQRGEGV